MRVCKVYSYAWPSQKDHKIAELAIFFSCLLLLHIVLDQYCLDPDRAVFKLSKHLQRLGF